MNCKPGDLAVIRGLVEDVGDNGRLVEVLAVTRAKEWLAPDGNEFEWGDDNLTACVVSAGSLFDFGPCGQSMYAAFDARNVCPIRDPGPDAVDEMLRPLPQPVEA